MSKARDLLEQVGTQDGINEGPRTTVKQAITNAGPMSSIDPKQIPVEA